jgi:hypothetical protein
MLATLARPLLLLPLGRSRYAGTAWPRIGLGRRREGYPIDRRNENSKEIERRMYRFSSDADVGRHQC